MRSSTKDGEIKKMAECIRLDMECAAICYATVQLIGYVVIELKKFIKYVQICVNPG